MKYAYKLLIPLTALCLLLSACTSSEIKSNKINLEFWTLQLSNQKDFMNNIIKTYEKKHPNIKIKWIDVPFSEGEKRALACVMSGNTPDIINMNPSFASTMSSKGALLILNNKIPENVKNKYIDSAWTASSINNNYFGIPWYITSSVTIYNKEILKNSGLSSKNVPQAYSELIKISEIIKNKSGKYAFMPNLTEDGFFLKVLNKYNIPIVNKEKNKATFNKKEAAQILEQWVNLYSKGYIPPESINQTHRVSLERFESGETAFIMAGANFVKTIKDDAPKIYANTDVAGQIKGSNNKVDFSLMNLVIPKKAKHPKEAIDFSLYLTNAENQLAFSKITPTLPSIKEAINSEYFSSKNEKDIIEKAKNISAKQLKYAIKPFPMLNNQKDLIEVFDIQIQKAILKEKTPQQALDAAAKEWDELLKG